jgi:DNA polymerase-3 subunit delta
MIYLLYGADGFSIGEALASMKDGLGPAELRDVNITVMDGASVGFEELVATCNTVPFLADRRLIVVEGLLSQFETRGQPRAGARATQQNSPSTASEPSPGSSKGQAPSTGSGRGLGKWEGLAEHLSRMPPTTELVFVEGPLNEANPLLVRLRPLAKVQPFPLLTGDALHRWIRQRASQRGVNIELRAVSALADAIGSDLRVIDSELQKLALYRWGQTVRHEDVQEMVSYVKEANIFAAVDAALEGRAGVALRLTHQLLDAGRPPSYLIAMLARQVRLLLQAKDLKARGIPQAEIGKRLALASFPLRKTLEQEGRFTTEQLAAIHSRLLEADVDIKTGGADEQLALDMLIAELAVAR